MLQRHHLNSWHQAPGPIEAVATVFAAKHSSTKLVAYGMLFTSLDYSKVFLGPLPSVTANGMYHHRTNSGGSVWAAYPRHSEAFLGFCDR